MSDFGTIFGCSLGGMAFSLRGYTKSAESILDGDGLRIGTKYGYVLSGEIVVATADLLGAALAAFETNCLAAEATAFSITAGTQTLESLAAASLHDGPHIKFAYQSDRGATYQSVTITVDGSTVGGESGGIIGSVSSSSVSVKLAVNSEGLKSYVSTGTVVTTQGTSASAAFLTATLPAWNSGWVLNYDYQANTADTQCGYTITRTELVSSYPSSGDDHVLDGECTISHAYDEHNRTVTRYSYDYVGSYAATYIAARHTALRSAGGLLRASINQTTHKSRHTTGEFEVLSSRDGYGLLELTETVSQSKSAPLLRELRCAGSPPLLVLDAASAWVYEQSGRAVGRGQYPHEMSPLWSADNYAEYPQITMERISDNEFATSWRYRWLFTAAQAAQYPHARPSAPSFYP